ncbi:hypothetical protein HZY83_07485 [Gemella sp. GH3]|nr:hypothetical protein [Gemella sp. GH3.1]NYS51468.1 hypothetical protein [Gemella sp. GH3]
MINYTIISSGSKGNCVIIENVMIDCGVPFKKIKECLYNINYLLITHIHSDHLNKSCVKQIRKLFPNIKIIGNYEVAQEIDVDVIANAGYDVNTKDYTFFPFECVHDVLCYGYIWNVNGFRIIYATDTNNLDILHNNGIKYDYIFIESNYDEVKIKNAKRTKGYDPKLSALRHMSKQKATEFYYVNRRDNNSKFIELHKSERFY